MAAICMEVVAAICMEVVAVILCGNPGASAVVWEGWWQ